jgi:DNA-binding SARP family transcriptional activator
VHVAHGDLLEDELFPHWAVEARSAARVARLTAALRGAEAALEVDEPARAADLAGLVTDGEPLMERGWQLAIEALGRAGRRAEAVCAYHECRAVLRRELGIDPDPLTQAVFQWALDGCRTAGRERVDPRPAEVNRYGALGPRSRTRTTAPSPSGESTTAVAAQHGGGYPGREDRRDQAAVPRPR